MSKAIKSAKNATEFLKMLDTNEVEFVDFLFTDSKGK